MPVAYVLFSTIIAVGGTSVEMSAPVPTQTVAYFASKKGCDKMRDHLIPHPDSRTENVSTYLEKPVLGNSMARLQKRVICSPTGDEE